MAIQAIVKVLLCSILPSRNADMRLCSLGIFQTQHLNKHWFTVAYCCLGFVCGLDIHFITFVGSHSNVYHKV